MNSIMPGWSGKSKGGTFGYRFFIFLIRYGSLRITYFFVRVVAIYYLLFSDKTAMRYYFGKIHGMKKRMIPGSIYRNYCMLGEVLVDRVAILSGQRSGYTFDFEGEEHLREMSRQGKGGVLVGAHMGNWEVAGQLLERIDTPVNIVMVDAEREAIRNLMEKVMVNKKIRIIAQGEDYSHLFEMEEAFSRNEFVVLHGDRFLPGANTVTLSFMGEPARFPAGPLYLASKKGVPVSFVFTMKEGRTHYHFYATPGRIFPYPANPRIRNREITSMVKTYTEVLERMVRKYPFQWFNYYPFWDTIQSDSYE
jgi:predicted LPLAT superfamily acyltransferase